jgi:hypothetical protein
MGLSDETRLEFELQDQTTNSPKTVNVTFCDMYGVSLWTGFGLMTRFTGLFDTASDYNLQFTVTHARVFIVTSLFLLGSGFKRRTLFFP